MGTVLQARVEISEAILVGLHAMECGDSHSIAIAPQYIELLQRFRPVVSELNLEEVFERQLLHLTSSLHQLHDLASELAASLRPMVGSGSAETSGQQSRINQYIEQLETELDWFEDKIETLSLALDSEFMTDVNRRIQEAPTPAQGNSNWKHELASLCD